MEKDDYLKTVVRRMDKISEQQLRMFVKHAKIRLDDLCEQMIIELNNNSDRAYKEIVKDEP